MKSIYAVFIACLVLVSGGCVNNRTENMAATCQSLLDDNDQASNIRFIRDAEEQLASLNGPKSKLTAARLNLQDKDAMKYKPALEHCIWQLKSRQ